MNIPLPLATTLHLAPSYAIAVPIDPSTGPIDPLAGPTMKVQHPRPTMEAVANGKDAQETMLTRKGCEEAMQSLCN